MKKRIEWLDVAKCFGVFAIYLGHWGTMAGNAHTFVYTHHVPLFFLLSGCAENFGEGVPFRTVVAKVFKQILIPWLVYCMIAVLTTVLVYDRQLEDVNKMLLSVLNGTIRNSFVAGGLWFLPCLAIMKIVFALIRKMKFKICILLTCAAMLWITQYRLPNNPLVQPSWLYNADSAMYYIFYYAVGYVSFPFICKALEARTLLGKGILIASGVAAFYYSWSVYFGKNLFDFVYNLRYVGAFGDVITALVIMWLYLLVARIFQNVEVFKNIGQNTLHLCGGEFTIYSIFYSILAVMGLGLSLSSPLVTTCYVVMLIGLGNRFFVPASKRVIAAVWSIPEYLKQKQAS